MIKIVPGHNSQQNSLKSEWMNEWMNVRPMYTINQSFDIFKISNYTFKF